MKSYQQIDLMVVSHLIHVNSYFDLRFIFYESSETTILNLSCKQNDKFRIDGSLQVELTYKCISRIIM